MHSGHLFSTPTNLRTYVNLSKTYKHSFLNYSDFSPDVYTVPASPLSRCKHNLFLASLRHLEFTPQQILDAQPPNLFSLIFPLSKHGTDTFQKWVAKNIGRAWWSMLQSQHPGEGRQEDHLSEYNSTRTTQQDPVSAFPQTKQTSTLG